MMRNIRNCTAQVKKSRFLVARDQGYIRQFAYLKKTCLLGKICPKHRFFQFCVGLAFLKCFACVILFQTPNCFKEFDEPFPVSIAQLSNNWRATKNKAVRKILEKNGAIGFLQYSRVFVNICRTISVLLARLSCLYHDRSF